MSRRIAIPLAALLIPAASAAPQELRLEANTQFIVPQARSFAVRPTPQPVQITSVEASATIVERTARTSLEIALQNPSGAVAEAVLLVPVPAGAVVSFFDFQGAASEPTAELLPLERARATYESIVRQSRDPALLEFAGLTLIRSSVFPIPPQGTQKVRIGYDHLLEGDGDRVDYLLPRSESLEQRLPWRISVDIKSSHPISMVYSPSHEVVAERRGPSEFHVTVAERARTGPGPFRLSHLIERNGVNASLFAYPDPTVGGGYFLLMAGLPASLEGHTDRLRREVTLVIDRSGSMAGEKMDQARAAALQVIEGLADGEAFNIIDYASTVSLFAAAPQPKDAAATAAARRYLESIRPGGGTNIHDALVEALRQPARDAMLGIVLFLTDGLPTIGTRSEVAIRQMVEQGNVHRRRVFTFGVGEDVNVPLLDRIASVTRATATYVLPREDVELKVASVFKRLYGPVLAEPTLTVLESDGTPTTRLAQELIPQQLPDLFEDDQLILLGQYRQAAPAIFQIEGNFLGRPRSFTFDFDLSAASTAHAFVPRLWASRRIAFLIDQIRQAGAASAEIPPVVGSSPLDDPRSRELVEEILRLSTRFGILTEYTAFLATEGSTGWAEASRGCSAMLDQRAVGTRFGAGAVNQALNYKAQWGQTVLNYDNSFVDAELNQVNFAQVQQMCDLAFFQRDGRWVDSRLLVGAEAVPAASRRVAVGSPEHLELLGRLQRDGRQGVLALRGAIVVQVDGEVVEVSAD
jgi:Ca-activated chloride channel family protein